MERRKCFRFPLPTDQAVAVIQIGRETFKAQVINKSSTGYGLLCNFPVPVVEQQTIHLTTKTESATVRVVRIVEKDGRWELGTVLLSEDEETLFTPESAQPRLIADLTHSKAVSFAGLAIAIVVCGIAYNFARPLIGFSERKTTQHSSEAPNPFKQKAASSWNAARKSYEELQKSIRESLAQSMPSPTVNVDLDALQQQTKQKVRDSVSYLSVFTSQAAQQSLRLDPSQQLAVSEEMYRCGEALKQLANNKSLTASSRADASRKIVEQTMTKLEGVLTAEQKASLEKLLSSSS